MTKLSLKNWWSHAFEKGIYPLKSLIEDPKWRKKTGQEIAFLRRILRLPRRSHILDVGCGVGRHAVELAKLGYDVTGVDISSRYLAEARRRARKQRVHAHFIRGDMRRLDFNKTFDAAINLFTSFGYFPSPSDDLKVLRGVCRALKPGGLFLYHPLKSPRLVVLARKPL